MDFEWAECQHGYRSITDETSAADPGKYRISQEIYIHLYVWLLDDLFVEACVVSRILQVPSAQLFPSPIELQVTLKDMR